MRCRRIFSFLAWSASPRHSPGGHGEDMDAAPSRRNHLSDGGKGTVSECVGSCICAALWHVVNSVVPII